MRLIISTVILSLVVGVLAILIYQDKDKLFFGEPVYEFPTVGMDVTAFLNLCGPLQDEDESKRIPSNTVFINNVRYKVSPTRFKAKCYGDFRFENGLLVSARD